MLTKWLALAGLVVVPALPSAARAQAPDPGTSRFDYDVTQLATNGHRTYVAGRFGEVSSPPNGDLLVSAVSGQPLMSWPDSYGVSAAIPDRSGGWYAAGGGTIRHLLGDGRVDPAFAGPKTDVDFKSLALSPDGATLWLGGKFNTVGGQPRQGLAALNAADGTLLPWNPADGGAGWGIAATADTLYATGYFTIGGTDYSLAAFDTRTGALRTAALPRADAGINLVIAPDGQTLYATFGSTLRGLTAAFDPATLTERWGTATGAGPVGMALAGDRLYLTGVGYIGDQDRDGAVALDTATGAPTGWFVPGMRTGLAVSPDGSTAYFSRGIVPGWPWQGGIAASTADGALLGWAPSGSEWYGADHPVMSPDGQSVFISDGFPGARARTGSAMLDETGTATPWTDPVPPAQRGPRISSAAMDAAGATYTTSMPRDPDDAGARTVFAVDAAGALRFRLALDGEATATLSPDQRTLYVVGSFTTIGGVARPGLAAVRTADGSLEPWSLTVAGGSVSQLAFSPDGATEYLTGSFTTVNGIPRTRVAAVDVASGTVLAFNPAPDRVPGVAVAPDGTEVYLYGDFQHVAGRAQARLAGLRVADGAVVFAPDLEYNVFAVAPLRDGHTVVAATDSPSRPLDSWDAAGGAELTFGADVKYGAVDALALDPDGQTLSIAGDFYVGSAAHDFARFALDRAAPAPVDVTPPRLAGDMRAYQWVECDPGTWNGHPAAYTYAWTLDGTPVAGFTGREFLLESGDVGRVLRCETHAGGAAAVSDPVTVAPGEPFMLPAPRRTAASPAPTAEPTATATPTPTGTAGPTSTPTPSPAAATAPAARVATPPGGTPTRLAARDRTPPRITVRRVGRGARLRLSEPAIATLRLTACRRGRCRTTTRTLRLATAERVVERSLPRGRYTLAVRVRDAAGNAAAEVVRFSL